MSSFLLPFFMRLSFCVHLSLLLLSCYDTANEYISLSDLVLVPAEFCKDSKRTWLPLMTVLSITTRHQQRGQGKMLELKEVKRKNKNKQATIRGMDWRGKNRKKRRKQENNATCWKIRRKKFVSRLLIHVTSISLCYLNWV